MGRLARALALVAALVLAVAAVVPLGHLALAREEAGPPVALPEPPPGTYTVAIVDWGYHTAVIIPQPEGWRLGPPGREGAGWVEYAWGDRGFYRDSDFRPHAVYATLVLPTPTVTYVEGRDRLPARGGRSMHAREVDAPTLRALAMELERSIRRDAAGRRVAPSPPVPGYAGRFHDAHGRYLWTRDCNRWTVERLAAVGLARGGGLVVFSGQVAGRLEGWRRVR